MLLDLDALSHSLDDVLSVSLPSVDQFKFSSNEVRHFDASATNVSSIPFLLRTTTGPVAEAVLELLD